MTTNKASQRCSENRNALLPAPQGGAQALFQPRKRGHIGIGQPRQDTADGLLVNAAGLGGLTTAQTPVTHQGCQRAHQVSDPYGFNRSVRDEFTGRPRVPVTQPLRWLALAGTEHTGRLYGHRLILAPSRRATSTPNTASLSGADQFSPNYRVVLHRKLDKRGVNASFSGVWHLQVVTAGRGSDDHAQDRAVAS